MGKIELEQILQLLEKCSNEQKREIFQHLRKNISIHPIEKKLNVQAETILEAIDRASDLTLRGVRGIIAEASFVLNVTNKLKGWEDITPKGDHSYDFFLKDKKGKIRIQLKMQRLKNQRPMTANEGYKILDSNMYVVETQRTRGGKNPRTGESTRPYKFGEFDILAVSMHPSTNDWSNFFYTVADWPLPRKEDPKLLLKFQPVPKMLNKYWTDDFETCVNWFREKTKKKVSGQK